MKSGFRGICVISWSQTEVDGLEAAPARLIGVGAAWSWRGDAVRVDGPAETLWQDCGVYHTDPRRRAAQMVHRLVGAAVDGVDRSGQPGPDRPMPDTRIVVTDGAQRYTVTVIDVGGGVPPLLMFVDEMPPRETDLWVEHHSLDTIAASQTGTGTAMPAATGKGSGVICFTPGTLIQTPQGLRPVEDLREGDRVQTKDNGAEDILWIGSRRMSGARMFAMPHLAPVRIRSGAFGIERPRGDLLVSPQHRMLIKGPVAQALFNTPEVLVSARDLVNDTTVRVARGLREVHYIHLLLPHHQVLWANGVETESFHPASAAMDTLDEDDRQRLLQQFPALARDPQSYGAYARRNLSAAEAAMLQTHAA